MVRRVFLDTNVWLRFFVKDDDKQYLKTASLFERIEAGEFIPYVSEINFLEIYYVLTKVYGVNKNKAREILEMILELRGLVVLKGADVKKALSWHQKYNLKFSDCLIISALPEKLTFVSWDRDFKKVKKIAFLTPADL